jgi:uncharacterized protein YecE (DUF72 family)
MAEIYVGTSGWSYAHWDTVFYPSDVKGRDRITYYSQHFDTVEINYTFYHLPREQTIKNWKNQVSKNFLFSIKASRYITHLKRLQECEPSVTKFFENIKHLNEKLGPILFQLPPSFKMEYEHLEEFLKLLPKNFDYTFEFRHPSWYVDEIYDLLKKYKVALCITDLGGKLSPIVTTADFTYIRLHGPTKAYKGSYGEKKVNEWKEKLLTFKKQKISSYCYFDNDEKGYAIQDATLLKSLLEGHP